MTICPPRTPGTAAPDGGGGRRSADAIVARGFAADTVRRVLRLVDLNEYKRRQAAVGPRITERGFGRDRRYPITSGWRLGE